MYRLYWFRFCTRKLLARSLERSSPKAIQNKLQILEEEQFIGKRYEKSFELAEHTGLELYRCLIF